MPSRTLLLLATLALAGCTPETQPTPTPSPAVVCHAPTEDSHPMDCHYRDGAWRPNTAASNSPVCHAPTEDSDITDCDYRDGAWWVAEQH